MTTFLLVRHGETDAVGKSMMGWAPGWHLNANGKSQVERLAELLAPLPIRAGVNRPDRKRRQQFRESLHLALPVGVQMPARRPAHHRFPHRVGFAVAYEQKCCHERSPRRRESSYTGFPDRRAFE